MRLMGRKNAGERGPEPEQRIARALCALRISNRETGVPPVPIRPMVCGILTALMYNRIHGPRYPNGARLVDVACAPASRVRKQCHAALHRNAYAPFAVGRSGNRRHRHGSGRGLWTDLQRPASNAGWGDHAGQRARVEVVERALRRVGSV
jgi:hypothetical protein